MFFLVESEVVILDIETTESALATVHGRFPEPVEIGAVKLSSSYEVLDEYEQLVKPTRLDEFTEFSEAFTGLTKADIRNASLFSEIWQDFANFTKFTRRTLLSWGAGFDQGVLLGAYREAKTAYPHKWPMIDALSLAVWGVGGVYGFKFKTQSLGSVCDRLGVPREEKPHRALRGAHKVVDVLRRLDELS
jgi:DNA polymerase III epsilon subunit-like protein